MKKIFTLIFLLVTVAIYSNAQGILVINEVDYDQPGLDSAEFIELYNAGSAPINLGGYRVIMYNCNVANPGVYDSFPLPSTVLNAGAFFVICGNPGQVPFCDMVHSVVSNMIQNGSPDAIVLYDTLAGTYGDALSYEGDCLPPYIEGVGVPLAQSDTGQTPYVGIGRFPDGNDTNDDSTDFHRACITPGTANVNTSTNCIVSVKSISVPNTLALYPNPSNGIVTIETSFKNVSVVVDNILGNEMKKVTLKNVDGNYQLNLTELQDGIYFVKIKSDAGESIRRVILKR